MATWASLTKLDIECVEVFLPDPELGRVSVEDQRVDQPSALLATIADTVDRTPLPTAATELYARFGPLSLHSETGTRLPDGWLVAIDALAALDTVDHVRVELAPGASVVDFTTGVALTPAATADLLAVFGGAGLLGETLTLTGGSRDGAPEVMLWAGHP